MKTLQGKRLLLLGGNLWAEAIKQYAEESGMVLVATSNDPTARIFEIANEKYGVSSTDAKEMVRLIQEARIDGVYMGGSEPVISAASSYLNELGLPCYCTHEQWEFLQDKGKFKEQCIRHGLPVAKRYSLNEEIDFPVITKPVDGSGSRGFSVCHNREELRTGYRRAEEASPTGRVIIEKFLKNTSVVVFYTLSNGKAYFSGLQDKYPVHYVEQGTYVSGMHLFESGMAGRFRELYEEKLKELFQSIGLKEGPVWIEVFCDSGNFYFNEAGYRYGGSISMYPVDYFYGINQVAADIYYALTGESLIFGFPRLCRKSAEGRRKYAVYSVHVKPGVITQTAGFDEIAALNNVVIIPIRKNLGETIFPTGTMSHVYSYVHFTYDNDNELRSMIKKIQNTVKVLDAQGKNMVNNMINADTLEIR